MDDARLSVALTEITTLEREIRFGYAASLSQDEKARWQEAHRNAAGLKVALGRWIEMRMFHRAQNSTH